MSWEDIRDDLDEQAESLLPAVAAAAETLGLPLSFLARALTAGAHVSCDYAAGERAGTGAARLALLACSASLAASYESDGLLTEKLKKGKKRNLELLELEGFEVVTPDANEVIHEARVERIDRLTGDDEPEVLA